MKKKLTIFIAVVLAATIILSIGVSAYAVNIGPDGCQVSLNPDLTGPNQAITVECSLLGSENEYEAEIDE